MGIGLAAKAAASRHFSIVVFCVTQILLDVEVLWHLIRRDPPLHRSSHTYLGASVVVVGLTIVGKPVSQWIKAIWNRIAVKCRDADLTINTETTWFASFAGAAFGAYSHILMDSLFHGDIEPLQPWSSVNRLCGVINPHVAEMGCIFLGMVGLAWFLWTERKKRKTTPVEH